MLKPCKQHSVHLLCIIQCSVGRSGLSTAAYDELVARVAAPSILDRSMLHSFAVGVKEMDKGSKAHAQDAFELALQDAQRTEPAHSLIVACILRFDFGIMYHLTPAIIL